MNWFLIIRLLSAHVAGDFLLQSKNFCERKKNLKTWDGWKCQIMHSLTQALLTYLFVAEWGCWQLPLTIFFAHLTIDVTKAALERDDLRTFVIDQILHLAVLFANYWFLLGGEYSVWFINWPHVWIIILSYVMVLAPASIFIEIFNSRFDWLRQSSDDESLADGGKHIGFLERILILSFIFCGWMEGIGYLLAAKSIFRFGDLKNSKDIEHTEYVLVGTFISFATAVVIGLMARMLLNNS